LIRERSELGGGGTFEDKVWRVMVPHPLQRNILLGRRTFNGLECRWLPAVDDIEELS